MYDLAHNLCAWLFNGASTSVVDFVAVIVTVGIGALIFCPFLAIIKKIMR